MSDTALDPIPEPEIDLDAMFADLNRDFQDPPEEGGTGEADADLDTGTESTSESGAEGEGSDPPQTSLPPGMVDFGGEIIPLEEAQALLSLNRQVKEDPEKARRVRAAVLGQQLVVDQTQTEPTLPEWLDPEDTQAVFMYRQQQKIEGELAQMKAQAEQRAQKEAVDAESTRRSQVVDAWRATMTEFHGAHPEFDQADLKAIADVAGTMGLLDNPEKVGGSLQAGFHTAMETAMWAKPEYRDKALHSATLRTKEQQAQDRKRKSSALSSSTGSTPRTQSQEARPTDRKAVMAQALDDLRSGNLTD